MATPVVIQSFLNPNDAYFAKSLLEDAGIPVFLYDENASGSTIAYSFATGGIKIAVPDQYSSEAIEIIEEYFKESKASEVKDSHEITICPKCNSKQIYSRTPGTTIEIILFLLVGLFTFKNPKKTKFACRNCRYTWRTY